MRINTITDLHRYVSDAAGEIDADSYGMEYDQLIDLATDNMLSYLKTLDFEWGDDLEDYEFTDKVFWEFFV